MVRMIYAIYDKVAEEMFGPLLLAPNDAAAVRTFSDAMRTREASHQEDYELYWLGSVDTEFGVLNPVPGDEIFGVKPAIITGAALVALDKERASNGEA